MLLLLLNQFLMPRFEELYAALSFAPSGSTLLLIAFLQQGPSFILLAAAGLAVASLSFFFIIKDKLLEVKLIGW